MPPELKPAAELDKSTHDKSSDGPIELARADRAVR